MKKPVTPRSQIKGALHRLWLRSRERNEALRQSGRCCTRCQRKHSRAKGREVTVEVHHIRPIDDAWDEILDLIYARILVAPNGLLPLCVQCHEEIHHVRR